MNQGIQVSTQWFANSSLSTYVLQDILSKCSTLCRCHLFLKQVIQANRYIFTSPDSFRGAFLLFSLQRMSCPQLYVHPCTAHLSGFVASACAHNLSSGIAGTFCSLPRPLETNTTFIHLMTIVTLHYYLVGITLMHLNRRPETEGRSPDLYSVQTTLSVIPLMSHSGAHQPPDSL